MGEREFKIGHYVSCKRHSVALLTLAENLQTPATQPTTTGSRCEAFGCVFEPKAERRRLW